MKWYGDVMSISKRSFELWEKIKRANRWYLRVLALIIALSAGFLTYYSFDVQGAGVGPQERSQQYGVAVTEGDKKYVYLHVYGTLPENIEFYMMVLSASDVGGIEYQGKLSDYYDSTNHWLKLPTYGATSARIGSYLYYFVGDAGSTTFNSATFINSKKGEQNVMDAGPEPDIDMRYDVAIGDYRVLKQEYDSIAFDKTTQYREIPVSQFYNCEKSTSCSLVRQGHMSGEAGANNNHAIKSSSDGVFKGWIDYYDTYDGTENKYYCSDLPEGVNVYCNLVSTTSPVGSSAIDVTGKITGKKYTGNICLGKKPNVKIYDKTGDNEITSNFTDRYGATYSNDIFYTGSSWQCKLLSEGIAVAKPDGGNGKYVSLKSGDIAPKSGITDASYDASGKKINISGYSGGDVELKIDAFKRVIYITSGNSTTFPNENLPDLYNCTSVPGEVEILRTDEGAWCCNINELDPSITSVNFEITGGDGCGFSEVVVQSMTQGCNISATALDQGKRILTFTVTDFNQGVCTVKVGGEKYIEYANKFYYVNQDDHHRILDYLTLISGTDPEVPVQPEGNNYVQIWTKNSPEGFNTYTVVAKPGYAVDSDFKVQSAGWISGLTDGKFTVQKSPSQNNDFALGPVKWRYQPTFSTDSQSIRDSIKVSRGEQELEWGSGDVHFDLSEDEKFTVTLTVENSRRKFCDNIPQGSIYSDVYGNITINRINDTTLQVTIPHSKTNGNVYVKPDVLEWRKSDSAIVIDTSGFDDDYYASCCSAVKLYHGEATTEDMPLESDRTNKLLYGEDKSRPYDGLVYTIECGPGVHFEKDDEGKIKADITATRGTDKAEEGELEILEKEQDRIVFRINPEYEKDVYGSKFTFNVKGLKSEFRTLKFMLCPSSELRQGDVQIASNKGNVSIMCERKIIVGAIETYSVFYTDITKIFTTDEVKVEPASSSGLVEKSMFSFNKVNMNITADFEGELSIIFNNPKGTNPSMTFVPIEGIKYYGVKDDGSGKKVIDTDKIISGMESATYGDDFWFAVKANEGYDISSVKLNRSGKEFESDDVEIREDEGYAVCKIPEAVSSEIISGSIRVSQCTVTFNKTSEIDPSHQVQIDYIYNGSKLTDNQVTVVYGQSLEFNVELPPDCDQSSIMVHYGNELVPKINGRYIIQNVTHDGVEVSVSGLKINNYPINFISNPKVSYKTQDDKPIEQSVYVEHGKEFKFKVNANEGYKLGESSVVSLKYADGTRTTLIPVKDIYTIPAVTQTCTISVENVEDMEYNITLERVDGVNYFNDVYSVITDKVKVKHGQNFEFYVSLDDAYDDSVSGMNIIVNDGKSSKSSAQKLASGRYIIPNVVEDMKIRVGNVRKNTYVVTLTDEEGIEYYNTSGKIITGNNDAEHYSDFRFRVDLYPAYVGSNITVMLGDTPMSADSNGFYTIPRIVESKTVTVIGVEKNRSSELVEDINALPDSLKDLSDVDDVIAATKAYEALSDEEKALVTNIDKLRSLQEQAKAFHHVSNDVTIEGVDWFIKLYAVPITDDTDACGRIYKKLNSEYILSLYDVYLWNTLTDTRYTLPSGEVAVVTLPTPELTYFEKPTAIHEKSSGKIDFISLSISGNTTSFSTDSFSPMGIVANRNSTPGRSSLLDATDADLDAISDFAAATFGGRTNTVSNTGTNGSNSRGSDYGGGEDGNMSGNIDEKFRSRNNKVTAASSALRLILVLMLLILFGLLIYLYVKRKKEKNDSK